jgi:hypothetical protein
MSTHRFAASLLALLGAAAGASACTVDAYCYSCEDGGVTNASGSGGSGGSGGAGGGLVTECAKDGDCKDGETCCSGVCANLDSAAAHCGTCGNSCESGVNSTATCKKGVCSLTCDKGYADCDLQAFNGCEINVLGNPVHCGDCKTACLFANAAPACDQGKCAIAECSKGFADCDKDVKNGCEVDLGTDPNNCSACANKCTPAAHAQAICQGGKCSSGGCEKGFGDCNGNAADGCEADFQNDSAHCGECGTDCSGFVVANGVSACVAGFCGVGACAQGYADCDASSFDGCESKLDSDVLNCGACGAPCGQPAHGTPKCEASKCDVATCDAGYDNCNGDPADGCEAYLPSDVEHCGACSIDCTDKNVFQFPHASPACAGSACTIGKCDAGWAHCIGDVMNGCETDLTTDINNCGKCSNICGKVKQGDGSCSNGLCVIDSCNAGYQDCDGDVANGCEKYVKDDVDNCGACNVQCAKLPNAAADCAEGVCGLGTCDPGFANCDNDPKTGCEKDVLSDPQNCGGCGITCGSGVCQNGACTCTKNVLVLPDDSATGSKALSDLIAAAGYTMTIAPVPSYQYNGTNPALGNFGAVVVLAGGPASTSYTTDMPDAGQTALVDFVEKSGNGVVMTEWAALHVASGRWKILKGHLVLLDRTAAFSGQETYKVDADFKDHPVWAGLPGSVGHENDPAFTFAATENVGLAALVPYNKRIAGGSFSPDTVAIRDAPVGRVVHVSYAGNYQGGWTGAPLKNMQQLMTNAVGWVTRCK